MSDRRPAAFHAILEARPKATYPRCQGYLVVSQNTSPGPSCGDPPYAIETFLAEHDIKPNFGQLIDALLILLPKQRHTHKDNANIKTGEYPVELEGQPSSSCGRKTWTRAEAGWDVCTDWADSAYNSTETEAHLKAIGLRSKIHR